MEDEDNSFEDLDIYSEDVDQMDSKVIAVAVLAFCSGVIGILVTAMNFSIIYNPGPLIYLIAFDSLFVITGSLGVFSLIAGWGLWQLEPWAWRRAMAVSVASLIFYLPILSILPIVSNACLVYLLRDPQLKHVYDDIELP